jgi:hypothetical protein
MFLLNFYGKHTKDNKNMIKFKLYECLVRFLERFEKKKFIVFLIFLVILTIEMIILKTNLASG